jgi:hypothetical protein
MALEQFHDETGRGTDRLASPAQDHLLADATVGTSTPRVTAEPTFLQAFPVPPITVAQKRQCASSSSLCVALKNLRNGHFIEVPIGRS